MGNLYPITIWKMSVIRTFQMEKVIVLLGSQFSIFDKTKKYQTESNEKQFPVWENLKLYMQLKKLILRISKERRLRSACTVVQADLSLCSLLYRLQDPKTTLSM